MHKEICGGGAMSFKKQENHHNKIIKRHCGFSAMPFLLF